MVLWSIRMSHKYRICQNLCLHTSIDGYVKFIVSCQKLYRIITDTSNRITNWANMQIGWVYHTFSLDWELPIRFEYNHTGHQGRCGKHPQVLTNPKIERLPLEIGTIPNKYSDEVSWYEAELIEPAKCLRGVVLPILFWYKSVTLPIQQHIPCSYIIST